MYDNSEGYSEITKFKQTGNIKTWEGSWGDYKNLLSGKDYVYIHSAKKGSFTVEVTLEWPPWLRRGFVRNVVLVPDNTCITEKVTIHFGFDDMVLEPINSEVVPGTMAEVYNPSCVGLNSDASFKIQVNSGRFPQDKVTWRSENGNVQFVGAGGSLSSEGKGYVVKARGMSVGEDKLIDGYDGVEPEISLDVLTWKDVNVGTWIVNDGAVIADSAFTISEIDEAIEYTNQVFKQIAVRLIRVPLVVSGNPNQADYYELPESIKYRDLINMRTYSSSDGVDLEVYFINGHRIIGETWVGIAHPAKGVVVSKWGNLNHNTTAPYRHQIVAHEILHCMRKNSVLSLQVYDIYEKNKGHEIHRGIKTKKSYIPLDWGNGYYSINTYQRDIIFKLLMFGRLETNINLDIPRGSVHGIDMDGNRGNVNCGGIVDLKDRRFSNDDQ